MKYQTIVVEGKDRVGLIMLNRPDHMNTFSTVLAKGLLAACDLTIASEETRIGTTAINVGLFCMGPAVPLSRYVGQKKALEMLLTGTMIDAWEAERIGLVNKVVPPEMLDEAAMELANGLAAKSPIALQMGKRAFYTVEDMEYTKGLDHMNKVMAELCTTEDAREGVNAFLKKRKPQWKER